MACRSWVFFSWKVSIHRLACFGNIPKWKEHYISDPSAPPISPLRPDLTRLTRPEPISLFHPPPATRPPPILLWFLPSYHLIFHQLWPEHLQEAAVRPISISLLRQQQRPKSLGFCSLYSQKGSMVVDHHNVDWFGRIEAWKIRWIRSFWGNILLNYFELDLEVIMKVDPCVVVVILA